MTKPTRLSLLCVVVVAASSLACSRCDSEKSIRRDPTGDAVSGTGAITVRAIAFSWHAAIHYEVQPTHLLTCEKEGRAACHVFPVAPATATRVDSAFMSSPPLVTKGRLSSEGVRVAFVISNAGHDAVWGLDYDCTQAIDPQAVLHSLSCPTRRLLLSTLPEWLQTSALTVPSCRCAD